MENIIEDFVRVRLEYQDNTVGYYLDFLENFEGDEGIKFELAKFEDVTIEELVEFMDDFDKNNYYPEIANSQLYPNMAKFFALLLISFAGKEKAKYILWVIARRYSFLSFFSANGELFNSLSLTELLEIFSNNCENNLEKFIDTIKQSGGRENAKR